VAGRSAQLTDFDRPDRRGAVDAGSIVLPRKTQDREVRPGVAAPVSADVTVVAPAPGAAPAAEKTAMAIEVIDTMATRNASTWLIVPQRDACVIADPDGGERMYLPAATVYRGWWSWCSRPLRRLW